VGLDYKELPRDVSPGSVLLLDDGRMVLDVQRFRAARSPPKYAWVAFSRTTRASTARAED